jgi:RNA ligase partner protein
MDIPVERYVLDTSLFTNPQVYGQFGPDAVSAIRGFLEMAMAVRAEFYMPGSVYEELRKVKNIDAVAAEFQTVVALRSPRKYALQVPSQVVYEFIEEVRGRIDRGLRIAEELARAAGQATRAEDVAPLINRLRERYREALRRGILDSKEDADVLLLAYELDGVLVSGDEGLRKWADKVGVKLVDPYHFRGVLDNLRRRCPDGPAGRTQS